MAVDGGAGNAISFSEIQAFYGGSDPISISEYNRGGSLVPTSFAGVSTATTANGAGTKNDFGVTQSTGTAFTGSLGSSTVRATNSATSGSSVSTSYTVLASDAAIFINGGGLNNQGGTDDLDATGSHSTTRNGNDLYGNNAAFQEKRYRGPASNGSEFPGTTFHGTLSTGDALVSTATVGSNSGSITINTARRSGNTIYDITFTNNNSTGDTYTLASSSTGYSTKSVYAAGDSQKVKDDNSSNQWTIAYDNVSGSGSGTAGDIGVTVTSQTDTRTTSTGFVSGQNTICTLQVPSHSGLSFVSATGTASEPNNDGSSGVSLKLNGTTVSSNQVPESSVSTTTYTGSASPGDTFQVLGGETGRSLSITFTTPSRSIVFQNNGSSSQTLGSSTTPGGARTIAAGASSTAQSAGSAGGFTNNQAWQVYFDTSSGNCNTNIPTTISSGNSVNLDLFNAPGTPVG